MFLCFSPWPRSDGDSRVCCRLQSLRLTGIDLGQTSDKETASLYLPAPGHNLQVVQLVACVAMKYRAIKIKHFPEQHNIQQ